VIIKLLKTVNFQKGDRLEIEIDYRKSDVWGVFHDENQKNNKKQESDKEISYEEFKKYHHDFLKSQIEKFTELYLKGLDIDVTINFVNDTKSFLVNLADIVCGCVNNDKKGIETIKCNCESVMTGDNPSTIIKHNPIGALSSIFSEVIGNQFGNVDLIQSIFSKTKSDVEKYTMVWNVFHNFLKYHLDTRYESDNTISKLNDLVAVFLKEFNHNSNKLTVDKRLDIINLFMAYYSHAGEIGEKNEQVIPIKKDDLKKLLNETGNSSESRVTRKWEKYCSYCFREVQIQFNAYNFSEAVAICQELWEVQQKVLKIEYPFETQKDEPATAILGSLAQSYAFNSQFDDAIFHCEMALEYVIKSQAQSASYLVTIYFLKQDIENVRKYFTKQTGKEPEEFAEQKNFKDDWEHLSYVKLRSLELYKNKTTKLPEIPVTEFKKGYPFPLILKWYAVAKYLENKDENKEIISEYLTKAIENLMDEKCGFAIKTLALPIIQIFAIVDNTNPYHAKYNSIVENLKKQSLYFADYIDYQSPLLNQIKNDTGLWERAMSLPFNYS